MWWNSQPQHDLCPTVGKSHFFHWTDAVQSAMYGCLCYCMIHVWIHKIELFQHHVYVAAVWALMNDTHHFFLECRTYEEARQVVTAIVRNIWEKCEQSSSLKLTLPLLLAPATICFLNSTQYRTILLSTFQFIKRSARIL